MCVWIHSVNCDLNWIVVCVSSIWPIPHPPTHYPICIHYLTNATPSSRKRMSLLALFSLPQAHTRMVAFQSSGFVQLAENHVQFQYHYVYINHISSASFAFSVEVRRRKRAGNTMSCYVSGHDLAKLFAFWFCQILHYVVSKYMFVINGNKSEMTTAFASTWTTENSGWNIGIIT